MSNPLGFGGRQRQESFFTRESWNGLEWHHQGTVMQLTL
jgi:hypothetical protein